MLSNNMKNISYILLTILIISSCHMRNTWVCEGNCFDGEGIRKWKDGGIEKGTWKDGELVGWGYQYFGKISELAGDSYEGYFYQSDYHGYGKYIDVSEDAIYVGEWKNGKPDGKGKSTWNRTQAYYEGDWKNGKWHGNGIRYWGESGKHANDKYEGEWKDDEMDGFGNYYWADGSYYVGEWRNGVQHGKGIYTFSNGEKLESIWRNGYCRELAINFWGESASTFYELIEEFNVKSVASGQPFIDAMSIALKHLLADPNSSINLEELKQLHLSAIRDNATVLSRLANIEEFDKKIKLKTEFTKLILTLHEFYNEFEKLFKILENGTNFDSKIESVNKQIYKKALQMKKQEGKFYQIREKFEKKYSII